MTSFWVATRFLKSSRGQTALIVVGIAVAISVQVFVGALISSLQAGLIDDTIGHAPQVTVTPSKGNTTIGSWADKVPLVAGTAGVSAVAVSASGNAFVDRGAAPEPAFVRGFPFANAEPIYRFSGSLTLGRIPQSSEECLIGKDLAKTLGLSPGDNLTLATPSGVRRGFIVSGIFDLGAAAVNGGWVLVRLESAQELFGYGSNVTSIEAAVEDVFQADTVGAEIEARLASPDVTVVNWKDANSQLLSGLEAQSLSSNMIQGFILVSVVVTIASVLSITVLQKSRQLGILKAMGLGNGQASLIFLYEGLLLGLGGALGGLGLGAGLLTSFTTFAKGPDGKPIIDITLDPSFLFASFAIAMASAAFAALLPARRSSRLSPIDVIRGV